METFDATVRFLHEVGMLAKTPRSGFAFLGTGKQSVAEHSHRMTLIAYALAYLCKEDLDREKLLLMCLLHDLLEARTGDLNYVNKKYVQVDDAKALEDIRAAYPFGSEIVALIHEYDANETLEARFAHDADQLELMFVLRQEEEIGNTFAKEWFDNCLKRLKTPEALSLANAMQEQLSSAWWFVNPHDPHWQTGGKKR